MEWDGSFRLGWVGVRLSFGQVAPRPFVGPYRAEVGGEGTSPNFMVPPLSFSPR